VRGELLREIARGIAAFVVNRTVAGTLRFEEASPVRSKTDAVEHCRQHIERIRAEIEQRERRGENVERLRTRLKTVETLRKVHEAARAAEAA
jgi:hypothetical protein